MEMARAILLCIFSMMKLKSAFLGASFENRDLFKEVLRIFDAMNLGIRAINIRLFLQSFHNFSYTNLSPK
jgi:hypothetical protein